MEALEVAVATEHLVGHRYQAALATLADIALLRAMRVERQAVQILVLVLVEVHQRREPPHQQQVRGPLAALG
tara:strand:- start:628 stop:843 length:216 start_codon:yes stop_codon:yes gene_type:complete